MTLLSKKILVVIMMLFVHTVSNAQVTSLWESSSTFGDKGTLYFFGNSTVQYYFVLDTVAGQCKIYNADSFSLISTLTSLGHLEYPYILVPDMNGNGEPEIIFQDYATTGYAVRIRDIVTGVEIKAWKEATNSYYLWSLFKTPGNSIIKISMYKTNLTTYQSSLVVFSLGVTATGVEEKNWNINQTSFRLNQNYPNPFNPSTVISFDIPEDTQVQLVIYDDLGRIVTTLINEQKSAGHYDVPYNTRSLSSGSSSKGGYASGVYFYQVVAGKYSSTKKMLLVR